MFNNSDKKGFTLIEILIVVAIIALLSSVILVGLGTFRAKGRDSRRMADLREVQNGLELYFIKNGWYPNASDWNGVTTALTGAGIGVSVIPRDLSSGWSYGYCVFNNGLNYVIAAYLEDASNPALSQYDGAFGCQPQVIGPGGASPNCGTKTTPTNKYCITF